jgi:beta-fructofuranosidase
MLRLPSAWMWDFWLADDGDRYHLFFLFASRAPNNHPPPARTAVPGGCRTCA